MSETPPITPPEAPDTQMPKSKHFMPRALIILAALLAIAVLAWLAYTEGWIASHTKDTTQADSPRDTLTELDALQKRIQRLEGDAQRLRESTLASDQNQKALQKELEGLYQAVDAQSSLLDNIKTDLPPLEQGVHLAPAPAVPTQNSAAAVKLAALAQIQRRVEAGKPLGALLDILPDPVLNSYRETPPPAGAKLANDWLALYPELAPASPVAPQDKAPQGFWEKIASGLSSLVRIEKLSEEPTYAQDTPNGWADLHQAAQAQAWNKAALILANSDVQKPALLIDWEMELQRYLALHAALNALADRTITAATEQ